MVIEQIGSWIKLFPDYSMWIYGLVIPLSIGVALLLLYVFLRPLLFKHYYKSALVPHGMATALDNLEKISYKHIGITIDFSKNDQDCIRHALMQGGPEATYTLIHVVETAGASYYGGQVLDLETKSDVDNLEKYVHALQARHYKAFAEIGYGKPSKAIANIVNEQHMDFLVMGSHGHKALKDLIFGTTVNSVRHMINVPVLVVKPPRK
jgi:manganese transport protein